MKIDARVNRPVSQTVVEALIQSLKSASAHNPNDAAQPAAILWTDRDSQWQPVIPPLRRLMPQLLALGEYEPEQRIGPSIWLRCVIDRALASPEIPKRVHSNHLPARCEPPGTRRRRILPGPPEAAGGATVPGLLLDAEERQGLDGGGVSGIG